MVYVSANQKAVFLNLQRYTEAAAAAAAAAATATARLADMLFYTTHRRKIMADHPDLSADDVDMALIAAGKAMSGAEKDALVLAAAALSGVERAEHEQAAALAAALMPTARTMLKAAAGEPEAIEEVPEAIEEAPDPDELSLFAAKIHAQSPDGRRRLFGAALFPLVSQVASMRWGPCTRGIQLRSIARKAASVSTLESRRRCFNLPFWGDEVEMNDMGPDGRFNACAACGKACGCIFTTGAATSAFVRRQGVCCDTCPRVYHYGCARRLPAMPEVGRCTLNQVDP
jgi:hypothetical protein